jgi:glycosyltransferase involved in cell wall biosynthesis
MLNVHGVINTLGYGVFTHGLMKAYEEFVSRELALFVPPFCPVPDDPQVQRWIENGAKYRKDDPALMIFQAPWLNRFSGRPMMGMPIFELDVFTDYEAAILRGLDVVLQPSHWGKKIVEAHGIKNVHVVPGGYDPRVFNPEAATLDQKIERIEKRGISFVHVGKFEPRKSSEEILRCYINATNQLSTRTNFCFHVANPFDPHWFSRVREVLTQHGFQLVGHQFEKGNARIFVPQERFSGDPRKLYLAADFGIWASKAEGWNLPLLECLACGIPCLTTDNTAQSDFIQKDIYPRELIIQSHSKQPTRVGQEWWQLDLSEITEKILSLAREPRDHLQLAGACLESVRKFTWENSARKLKEVLMGMGIQ